MGQVLKGDDMALVSEIIFFSVDRTRPSALERG